MAMIALEIPLEISEKLSKISVPGKKLSKNEMHITMFYFEDKLNIKDMFKIIESSFNSIKNVDEFIIKLSLVTSFPEGDDGIPIIIPIVSEELHQLRKKIAKRFDQDNIDYSKKWPEYKPHLTLSYSSKEMKDKNIEKISWKNKSIVFYGGKEMDDGIKISLPFGLYKKSFLDKSCYMSDLFLKLSSCDI